MTEDAVDAARPLAGRGALARARWAGLGLLLASALAHASGHPDAAAPPRGPGLAPTAELERAAALVREENPDAAVAMLEDIKQRYPSDPAAYNELAKIHAARGDLERARALLIDALATEPRYAVVYENLQKVFGHLASRAYDRALLTSAGEKRPVPALASLVGADPMQPRASPRASNAPSPTISAAPAIAARVQPRPVTAAAPVRSPDSLKLSASTAPARQAPGTTATRPAAAQPTAAAPAPPPADPDAVAATVRAWAAAWSSRDVERYLAFYGHHFATPRGMSRKQWVEQRRERLRRPRFIEVDVDRLDVSFPAPDRAIASFSQSYRSNVLRSTVKKVLRLSRAGGEWKIVSESVRR